MAKTRARAHLDLKSEVETKEGEKAFGSRRNKPKVPAEKVDPDKNLQAASKPNTGSVFSVEQGEGEKTLGTVIGYAYLDPKRIKTWEYKDRTLAELEWDKESLEEFTADVEEAGFTTPIVVRPIEGASENDEFLYEEIAGFKRHYVAKKLNLPIPAEIRKLTDAEAFRLQKSENTERTEPSFWSRAISWSQLDESFGATQRERAKVAGASESQFSTALRLVRRMPEEVVKSLRLYTFGYNALIALLQFIDQDDDSNNRQERIDRVIENADRFDARPEKAESIIRGIAADFQKEKPGSKPANGAEVVTTQKGGKVFSIKRKKNGATIDLHQIGMEFADLNEIRDMLLKHLKSKGVPISD